MINCKLANEGCPKFILNGDTLNSSTESKIEFPNKEVLALATGALNSNLFWLFYVAFSSFHHVNPSDILNFHINFNEMSDSIKNRLIEATMNVMQDMQRNSEIRQRVHKGGNASSIQTFFPSKSKLQVDAVDHILSEHYGFTPEELDFIINYDIKYRMGRNNEDEE